MKLVVATPTAMVVSDDEVVSLRAEDASGSFGIWPRHADLITVLTVSVISWRRLDGSRCHCAVRGGVLTVRNGEKVSVTSQDAVVGTDLETLEGDVLASLRAADEAVRDARIHARRLHLAALEHLVRYSRPDRFSTGPGQLVPRRSGMDDER